MEKIDTDYKRRCWSRDVALLKAIPRTSADNGTTRVAWMSSWRMKMTVGSLGLPTRTEFASHHSLHHSKFQIGL